MFNILPPALTAVKILCPEVDIEIKIYPQTQESHLDPIDLYTPAQSIHTRGSIQTQTPAQNDIIVSTINSARLFRIYIPRPDFDILGHIQSRVDTLTCDFIYSNDLIHTRVYGFKDYRYDGWVALLASQAVPSLHNPHHAISPDIITN